MPKNKGTRGDNIQGVDCSWSDGEAAYAVDFFPRKWLLLTVGRAVRCARWAEDGNEIWVALSLGRLRRLRAPRGGATARPQTRRLADLTTTLCFVRSQVKEERTDAVGRTTRKRSGNLYLRRMGRSTHRCFACSGTGGWRHTALTV